ncbi:hypothetical protein B484DRAFT_471957, partial [Ochromonadaceae sp. CCMP2298]
VPGGLRRRRRWAGAPAGPSSLTRQGAGAHGRAAGASPGRRRPRHRRSPRARLRPALGASLSRLPRRLRLRGQQHPAGDSGDVPGELRRRRRWAGAPAGPSTLTRQGAGAHGRAAGASPGRRRPRHRRSPRARLRPALGASLSRLPRRLRLRGQVCGDDQPLLGLPRGLPPRVHTSPGRAPVLSGPAREGAEDIHPPLSLFHPEEVLLAHRPRCSRAPGDNGGGDVQQVSEEGHYHPGPHLHSGGLRRPARAAPHEGHRLLEGTGRHRELLRWQGVRDPEPELEGRLPRDRCRGCRVLQDQVRAGEEDDVKHHRQRVRATHLCGWCGGSHRLHILLPSRGSPPAGEQSTPFLAAPGLHSGWRGERYLQICQRRQDHHRERRQDDRDCPEATGAREVHRARLPQDRYYAHGEHRRLPGTDQGVLWAPLGRGGPEVRGHIDSDEDHRFRCDGFAPTDGLCSRQAPQRAHRHRHLQHQNIGGGRRERQPRAVGQGVDTQ